MEIAVLLPVGVQTVRRVGKIGSFCGNLRWKSPFFFPKAYIAYVEWEKTAIFALKEFGLEASKPRRTAESKAKA